MQFLMKVLKIENAVPRKFHLLYGEEEIDNLQLNFFDRKQTFVHQSAS